MQLPFVNTNKCIVLVRKTNAVFIRHFPVVPVLQKLKKTQLIISSLIVKINKIQQGLI